MKNCNSATLSFKNFDNEFLMLRNAWVFMLFVSFDDVFDRHKHHRQKSNLSNCITIELMKRMQARFCVVCTLMGIVYAKAFKSSVCFVAEPFSFLYRCVHTKLGDTKLVSLLISLQYFAAQTCDTMGHLLIYLFFAFSNPPTTNDDDWENHSIVFIRGKLLNNMSSVSGGWLARHPRFSLAWNFNEWRSIESIRRLFWGVFALHANSSRTHDILVTLNHHSHDW